MKIGGIDAATNAAMIKVSGVDQAIRQLRTASTGGRNAAQTGDFERSEGKISEKVLADAIDRANKAISGSNRSFEYSIHEKTGDIIVKVIDSSTHQVIREIPPRKILDLVAKLMEMAGILVDERR